MEEVMRILFAEDEEDWAYDVITLEEEPRYLTYLCSQLAKIEELK